MRHNQLVSFESWGGKARRMKIIRSQAKLECCLYQMIRSLIRWTDQSATQSLNIWSFVILNKAVPAVKLQRGIWGHSLHCKFRTLELYCGCHSYEKAETTGVACKVTYQFALMLRLDMVCFSSLAEPLRAQFLQPCSNSRWKSEVRLPNESSHY